MAHGVATPRITNESEYRAWNVNVNGIKRQTGQVDSSRRGYFGAINLLAPRPAARTKAKVSDGPSAAKKTASSTAAAPARRPTPQR